MTTTNTMHDASNKLISNYLAKKELKFNHLLTILNSSPGMGKINILRNNKISIEYEVFGHYAFTIFVVESMDKADSFKVSGYRRGFEIHSFNNVSDFYDVRNIIQLIAFQMTAQTNY